MRHGGNWDEQGDVGDGGKWSGLRGAELPGPAGWKGEEEERRRSPGCSCRAELMELFRHSATDALGTFREVSN